MIRNARQTILGKALEYACVLAVQRAAGEQHVAMEETPQLQKARLYYEEEISERERTNADLSADAGVRILLRYEPQILNPCGNEPLIISLVSDQQGQTGDVRDVLCLRKQNGWEIGISCKHNHAAVKHSRLSDSLDFGKKWLDIPCSAEYFEAVKPLFSRLRRIRKESHATAKWDAVGTEDGKMDFYQAVLDAFIRELRKLHDEHPGEVARKLVGYLIGKNDFYKLITDDSTQVTEIQAFNLYGTLNRCAGSHKAVSDIRRIKLPTKIRAIEYLEENGKLHKNTVAVYCDNGWEISMRIHNASSRVEPSLKFDVQLLTFPKEISKQIEPWQHTKSPSPPRTPSGNAGVGRRVVVSKMGNTTRRA